MPAVIQEEVAPGPESVAVEAAVVMVMVEVVEVVKVVMEEIHPNRLR